MSTVLHSRRNTLQGVSAVGSVIRAARETEALAPASVGSSRWGIPLPLSADWLPAEMPFPWTGQTQELDSDSLEAEIHARSILAQRSNSARCHLSKAL